MRISRKSSSCLNCGSTLDKVYNYCPNCGQGNHNDNVSFGTLVNDFFSTYFAIDSKFGKTFKPFFIKPGYLTTQYVKGKRESYAHPIRLYLIISIFYFFTVTIAARYMVEDEDDGTPGIKTSTTYDMLDDVEGIEDSTGVKILKELSGREKSNLKHSLEKEDLEELKTFLATLDSVDQLDIREAIGDSIADSLAIIKKTNHLEKKRKELPKQNDEDDEDEFILSRIDFNQIQELDNKHGELTDEQIYDSLDLGELSYFEDRMTRQSIRVNRATEEQVTEYVVGNFPLMMLLLIPLFALILKLHYLRRKELYIKHLVHALHLHSFAYLLYGVFILITTYIITHEDAGSVLNIIAFVIVSVYAFISFLRVYKQHWFKTLIKFNIVGFAYCITIFLFFLVEMVISLFLF